MFSSWGVAQWVLAGYLVAASVGWPVTRYVMIEKGAKGFGSWREYWQKWAGDLAERVALAVLLFVGGFWA